MKITEQALLDGYNGKTKGGDNISDINGTRIFWCYRTGEQNRTDGYNPQCHRPNADEITMEYDRVRIAFVSDSLAMGAIPLQTDCDTHPSVTRIATDEAEMWGAEVPSPVVH